MNIFKVMQRLPHRYPFLLIDRILEVEMPNKRLKALKNVTINEPFFGGHFPHRPVMPGVLVLEAMAQASSLLLTYPGSDDGPDTDTLYYFAGIDNARFKRPASAFQSGCIFMPLAHSQRPSASTLKAMSGFWRKNRALSFSAT